MRSEAEICEEVQALLACSLADLERLTAKLQRATEALVLLDVERMDEQLECCQQICAGLLEQDDRREKLIAELDQASEDAKAMIAQGEDALTYAMKKLRATSLLFADLLRRSRVWVRSCQNILATSEGEYTSICTAAPTER